MLRNFFVAYEVDPRDTDFSEEYPAFGEIASRLRANVVCWNLL